MELLGQNKIDHHQRQVVILSQDSFYKVLTPDQKAKAQKGQFNFDHPGMRPTLVLLFLLRTPDTFVVLYSSNVVMASPHTLQHMQPLATTIEQNWKYNQKLLCDVDIYGFKRVVACVQQHVFLPR